MASYAQFETESLEIEFLGEKVDLLSLGVTQISLQRIADRVTHEILSTSGVLAPGWKWSTYPSRWYRPEYPQLVQVEVTEASTGSYHSLLTFALLTTLSDPHVIAILDNLAANIIWAVATSGLQGVFRELSNRISIPDRLRQKERDPYEIESLVRDVLIVAEQNPNIRAIRLRSGQNQVTLDLEFYREKGKRRR